MEDTDEFKWAVKVVIKRQMRDLLEQLRESGEEVAVLSVNTQEGTCSHFGSPRGEWFISEQKNLTSNFLNFCKSKAKKTNMPSKGNKAGPATASKTVRPVGQPAASAPSSSPALLKIKVPKQLSESVSKDLAGMVGNLLATKMKGNASGDSLVTKAIAKGGKSVEKRVAESPADTPANKRTKVAESPRSTRSGRPVSNRYLETLKSLKKSPKKTADDVKRDPDYDAVESYDDDDAALEDISQETDDGERSAEVMVGQDRVKVLVSVEDEEMDAPVDTNSADMTDESDAEDLSQDLGVDKLEDETIDGDEIGNYDDEEEEDTEYVPKGTVMKSIHPRKAQDTVSVTDKKDIKKLMLRKKKKKKSRNQTIPIQCEYCGDTIIGMSNLKCHISRVHLREKTHVCDICSKGFWGNSSLEAHKLAVHTRQCEACKEYVVESVPWGEGVTPQTRRDIICQCGATVTVFSMIGRRRQYTREDEDSMSNSQKSDPATKYACGTCGKLFLKKANCERHARTHTEVKNIVCEICGNKYMFEGSLKKHLFQEHNIVKNICDICGKNYSNPRSLRLHITKVHGIHQDEVSKDKATYVTFEKEMDELAEEEEDDDVVEIEVKKELDDSVNKIATTTTVGHIVAQTTASGQVITSIDKDALEIARDSLRQLGNISIAQGGSGAATGTSILWASSKQIEGEDISRF